MREGRANLGGASPRALEGERFRLRRIVVKVDADQCPVLSISPLPPMARGVPFVRPYGERHVSGTVEGFEGFFSTTQSPQCDRPTKLEPAAVREALPLGLIAQLEDLISLGGLAGRTSMRKRNPSMKGGVRSFNRNRARMKANWARSKSPIQ